MKEMCALAILFIASFVGVWLILDGISDTLEGAKPESLIGQADTNEALTAKVRQLERQVDSLWGWVVELRAENGPDIEPEVQSLRDFQ